MSYLEFFIKQLITAIGNIGQTVHKFHKTYPGEGGGGVLGISSDGDDQMEPKVNTQKIP